MTQVHLKYVMFQMARQNLTETNFKDQNIRPILQILVSIFAIKELQKDNQMLYEVGFFGAGSIQLLNDSYNELLL